MNHVYHYHATVQESATTLTNIDGIVVTSGPLITYGQYQKLKEDIATRDKFDLSKLVITSLTLLGTSPDPTDGNP